MRIQDIFSSIMPVIFNKTGSLNRFLDREPGIYKDNKIENIKKTEDIRSLLNSLSTGFVIDDEWNNFTIVFPSDSNTYLFHWSTGA